MGKNPADQFYFGDLQRDMHGVQLLAVGGWSLLLCKMHFAKDRGKVTMCLDDYARFWGVTPDEAQSILDHLVEMDVGDRFCSVDGRITMVNRRMVRDSEAKAKDAERKREERDEERRQREELGEEIRPRGRPPKNGNSVQIPSKERPPSSSSSDIRTSSSGYSSSDDLSETDSCVHACVRDFPDADPKLVEIAVIKTLIQHRNSPTAKPIRTTRYFREEIEDMLLHSKKLGTKAIDAMLFSYRKKAEQLATNSTN